MGTASTDPNRSAAFRTKCLTSVVLPLPVSPPNNTGLGESLVKIMPCTFSTRSTSKPWKPGTTGGVLLSHNTGTWPEGRCTGVATQRW